jgi:anti-sigma regulatory factor (Ser/Thr protein kinase)
VDEVRLVLKRSAGAPREARHAMRDWLATVGCPEQLREDMLLVVSELVTNAVIHARSDPVVVAMFDDGRLRIEVHDEDRSPPIVTSSPGSDGGFGIRLVAALSDGWGWAHTESGKRVWIETLC